MAGPERLQNVRNAIGVRLISDGRGWILLTVAAGWLTILGIRFIIPALLPQIKAAFTINNTAAGLAVTLIWLTYAAMQFPAGVLVDRVGERALLVGSLVIGGLCVLLISSAPLFALFLLACAGFGLGTGLFGPPRATILSKTFEERDGTAFGIVLAAGSLGAAIMPFLAGFLVVRLGWRTTLAVFVPACAAVALGLWIAIPRGVDTPPIPGRHLRADLPRIGAQLARPPVIVATTAAMLMLFVFQGLTAFFPTYLVTVKALDQSHATALYAVLFVSGAVFQTTAGGAADRFGHGRVLVAISLISILPLAGLPFVHGSISIAVLSILLGIRIAMGPVSNAYVVRVLADDVMGATWGLVRTLFFMIGSTGSIFVGALADRGYFDEAFFVLAGLTFAAAILYAFLPDRDTVTA